MPNDGSKEIIGTVNFTEKTRAQIITSFGMELANPLVANFTTYRTMRKHPTLALARSAIAAPILAGSWSVEASDELKEDKDKAKERIKFIKDQFDPLRDRIMESSALGGIDFGNQPFELVYEADEEGRTIIGKAKPLILDITQILIDEKTGAFAGYEQNGVTGGTVILEPKYTLHIAFRIEGTDWYGSSLMENARESYNQWNEASLGAERYDAKVAGSHWIVFYPIGATDVNGTLTDNSKIAENMLDALESSGSLVVPNTVAAFAEQLSNDNPMWRIELMEDKGSRQPGFTDRLNYLDKLLVRSLLLPERAVLEGQFGTKAEAGVHADLAITIVELWHKQITEFVNHFAVDRILELNFGRDQKGSVWLKPTPLVDAQLAFLQKVYLAILSNASTMLEEFPTINTDAMKDGFNVPKSEEVAQAGEVEDDGVMPPEGLELAQRIRMLGKKLGIGQ